MRDSIVWGGKPRVLAETLFRAPRQNGMQAIQTCGEGGTKELSSWRVRRDANESVVFRSQGTEAVLVLQEGAGTLEIAGSTHDVSRKNVF